MGICPQLTLKVNWRATLQGQVMVLQHDDWGPL